MLLMMDLHGDLRELVKEQLREAGYLPKESQDAGLLYGIWREHQMRFVPQMSHAVKLSKELIVNPHFETYRSVVDEIANVLKVGGDVRPYMSSRLMKFSKHGRDHLQLHWGLIHFHLNSIATIGGNGLVDRSDHLLFVRVKDGVAYFVNIASHAQEDIFEDKRLLEIVDRNWPDLHVHVKGLTGYRETLTPGQIKHLRRSNTTHLEWVNGRMVMPVFGPTAAGIPGDAIMHFGKMQRDLDRIQKDIRERFFVYFPLNRSQWLAYVRLCEVNVRGYQFCEVNSGQRAQTA